MGLLDFVKNAGVALGLGKEEEKTKTPEPQSKTRTLSPEEVKRTNDRRRAMGLVKLINDFGFEVEELSVRVDDDLATVGGRVATQEVREKIVLAAGNVAGIARVDDRLDVAAPKATFYTVKAGDTLSKIAKQHYGDAGKYPVIFEANKPMLEHPDKIYPGQVLRIPPLAD